MKNILLFLLIFVVTRVAAQSTTEVLTIENCRQMALEHNKEIKATTYAYEYANFTAKSYKGNFLPNIYASGIGLYSNADGGFNTGVGYLPTLVADATGSLVQDGGYAYFPGMDMSYEVGAVLVGGVTVEQPLYMGGKISTAYKMALLGKDIAHQQQVLTATEIIEKTDEAYALVVRATEMKKVAETYNNLLQELMKTVESAHNHGMKPRNDVLKVQVKLNESELSMKKADNALQLAKMNLCHYIGKPVNSDVEIVSESTFNFDFVNTDHPRMSDQTRLSSFNCNVQRSTNYDVSNRPEYAMLDKQVELAYQQVRLNRSELLPQIGVSASYNYVYGGEVNNSTLFDRGMFLALLNVNIPLFHFGERKHKVNAAKAKLLQAQMEQQDKNEQMVLELAQATNNLEEAFLERDIAERSLVQAEENMRVSRSQYNAGMETLSDHLEAQTLWQQAYETKVDANYKSYLAYVAYQKASGTLYKGE